MVSFFACRWRGEIPAQIVLWRDMLLVGTGVNVAATLIALLAAAQGGPVWAVAAIHFSPLPYNAFLFVAVARSAPCSRWATALSIAWLAAMTIA
jgi:hypothetical protein